MIDDTSRAHCTCTADAPRRGQHHDRFCALYEHGSAIADDMPTCRKCGLVMRPSDVAGRYVCDREADPSHCAKKDNQWHSYAERMSKLAESFPALNRWGGTRGVRPWDPDLLIEGLGVMSHSEQLIVRFLLGVWSGNAEIDGCPRFDLLEAWSCFDEQQRAATIAWLEAPFWPWP